MQDYYEKISCYIGLAVVVNSLFSIHYCCYDPASFGELIFRKRENFAMNERKAGVLLHISSFPGTDAIGTINDGFKILRLFNQAQVRTWQILPIGPTIIGDSPFQGPSAFAGNPNLINLEALVTAGDLPRRALKDYYLKYQNYLQRKKSEQESSSHFEFIWSHKLGFDRKSWGFKHGPLRAAFSNFKFKASRSRRAAYAKFVKRCASVWLDDYALFMALKAAYGFPKQWSSWSKVDRFRQPGFGEIADRDDIEFYKYTQFVFDEQMLSLRRVARQLKIEIVGDIPMYPAYDSADVWANPDLFQLDNNLKVTHVACVPPDNFNPKGGQLWGNPLYRWGIIGDRRTQLRVFNWWMARLRRLLEYHDVIKIDHFRGLVAYGRVAAGDKDARRAKWTGGPGVALFSYLRKRLGKLQIIAEDLGVITTPVREALNQLKFPGMRLLQFGNFSSMRSIHLPHAAPENSVMYTGTHDNPTLMEWYQDFCDKPQRSRIDEYLKSRSEELGISWQAIDLVLQSQANRAVLPMQDLLELGGDARMNFPSRIGYWRWRMSSTQLSQFRKIALPRLRRLISSSNRAGFR